MRALFLGLCMLGFAASATVAQAQDRGHGVARPAPHAVSRPVARPMARPAARPVIPHRPVRSVTVHRAPVRRVTPHRPATVTIRRTHRPSTHHIVRQPSTHHVVRRPVPRSRVVVRTKKPAAIVRLRRNFHSPRRYHFGAYHRPNGWYAHRWAYGQRLPRGWYGRDYWITDWALFGLIAPPTDYVWVRVGDDAVLIDADTGEIIQVAYDVFY